jgi:hypothetical protein
MDLRGMDGVRGVDVERPDGSKVKLNADKSGRIEVNDRAVARKLRDEGFTVAAIASGFARGWPCECGFDSVFKKCGKCGRVNG